MASSSEATSSSLPTNFEDEDDKRSKSSTDGDANSLYTFLCLKKCLLKKNCGTEEYKEIGSLVEFKKLLDPVGKEMPFLQKSLFENVPPMINFYAKGTKVAKPTKRVTSTLKWCHNTLLPIVMKNCLAGSFFKVVDQEDEWLGYWGRHMKSNSYKSLHFYQKVNHVPGAFHIGRKDRLWQHLSEMMDRLDSDDYFVMPKTYILPKEINQATHYLNSNPQKKLILKPPASARGVGIVLSTNPLDLHSKEPMVAQEYVENPLLINGAKFDLRFYVIIPSFEPLRVYLHEDGLVRFASLPYSNCPSEMGNKYIYLTNYSINKNAHSEGLSDEPVAKWKMGQFWEYMTEQFGEPKVEELKENIKDVARRAVLACEFNIREHAAKYYTSAFSGHNTFEMFGMDILIDDTLKPWLLEMNISPSLHSQTLIDQTVKGPLAADILNMICLNLPPNDDIPDQYTLNYCVKNNASTLSKEHIDKSLYFENNFSLYQMSSGDILEELTDADVRMLIAFEDEYKRRGSFELLYPLGKKSEDLLCTMDSVIYANLLLYEWTSRFQEDREQGIFLLNKICENNYHLPNMSIDGDSNEESETDGTSIEDSVAAEEL
uniref:Tubulin--tyrosine ligase-like protein 9 n=1 Tax=Rhabditophanes sp. KR3021 TaxID=114890 RepID=A0AC35TM56_9BILA